MVLLPRPTPPADWLMVYNTDNANSLADAQWYAAQRGLHADYMGFNFGAGFPNIHDSDWSGAAILCQNNSTQYRGVIDNSWAGANMQTALQGYFNKYQNGGLLMATYTPNCLTLIAGSFGYPLAAWCASQVTSAPGVYSLANGRMGFVGNIANSGEYVSKFGGSLFRTAVINALAAEAANNAGKNHWSSNAANVNYTPFVQATDNAAVLTYLKAQGFSTVNLGVDYPFNTGSPDDWLTGSVPSKPNLFSLCLGAEPFNNYSGYAGAAPYTNNYTVQQGAWGFTWTSSAFNFIEDLFWNGGVGGITCVDEPAATGLRNPSLFMQGLINRRLSMAEAVITHTYYGQSVCVTAYPGYFAAPCYSISAFGDPLYKPYKNTPAPAQNGYFGLLPGGILVS